MASCGGLSPRQHRDSSQPANPRYLMTVSAARDLTLVYILPGRAAEAYSASIMSFRGNAKFINNVVLFPPPPFLSVCVYKTIIMRLWVLHTYVMSWGLWSVNERRMSHPIHLDCLTLLHRLIFLIRLPHTLGFLVASLWAGPVTILGIIFVAFIFNPNTRSSQYSAVFPQSCDTGDLSNLIRCK